MRDLPDGWEWLSLEDLATGFINGGTPSTTNDAYWQGTIPWITSASITSLTIKEGFRYITQEALENSSTNIVPKENLIFVTRVGIGKAAVNSIDCAISQDLTGVVIDKNIALPEYLARYIQTPKVTLLLDSWARGSTIKGLKRDQIEELMFPIPSIDTQRKIVAILDKAEETRRLRAQANELTQTLLQSVFLEMFGDPIKNSKSWDKVSIGDISGVKTGSTPKRNVNAYWEGGLIPWLKTTEVQDSVVTSTEERITDEAYKNSNVELFPEDTIIMAMYGQGKTRGRTAKLGIAATTNQACAAILPSDRFNSDFIWHQLVLMYDNIRELGRGGNQPNLNLEIVRNIKVIFPPKYLQDEYSRLMSNWDKVNSNQKKVISRYDVLFDSLLARAFTGDLVA